MFILVLMLVSCNSKIKEATAESKSLQFEIFCLENPPSVGKLNGTEFFEGGFSGLAYDKEAKLFYTVTDRGPNLKFQVDSISTEIKVFPFPTYQPKILQLEVDNKILIAKKQIPLFNTNKEPLVGLPLANNQAASKEIAWQSVKGTKLEDSPNGADVEALAIDSEGFFWIAEEYQTSFWKIDASTGMALEKYTPNKSTLDEEKSFTIDSVFAFRKPNRGLESIAITTSGNIWSILQSPAWFPSKEKAEDSRLVRMIKLDPTSKSTQTYFYEMSEEEGVRTKKWKVGDMVAITETQFLLIEHAIDKEKRFSRVIKIDVENTSELSGFYEKNGFYPEELKNAAEAKKYGIEVAKKRIVIDLVQNGFDESHAKPEGISFVNDTTIVVVNDNDYAIEFSEDKTTYLNNLIKSCLYFYYLPKSIYEY
jgi:hypothetical protein